MSSISKPPHSVSSEVLQRASSSSFPPSLSPLVHLFQEGSKVTTNLEQYYREHSREAGFPKERASYVWAQSIDFLQDVYERAWTLKNQLQKNKSWDYIAQSHSDFYALFPIDRIERAYLRAFPNEESLFDMDNSPSSLSAKSLSDSDSSFGSLSVKGLSNSDRFGSLKRQKQPENN